DGSAGRFRRPDARRRNGGAGRGSVGGSGARAPPRGFPLHRHRGAGRDALGAARRGGGPGPRWRAGARRPGHGQVHGGPRARRAAAADAGRGGLPLQLRPVRDRRLVRRLPRPRRAAAARAHGAGARGGPAARRHGGPRGRRARHRAGADARREGLRAGAARPRAPRLPLHRRGEPVGGPLGGPLARRRRFRREPGGARRAEPAPPGALRAGGQRQPRGRRAAPATAGSLRSRGGGADAHRPAAARRGGEAPRRFRARSRRLRRRLGAGGGEAAPEHPLRAGAPAGHRSGRRGDRGRGPALHGARHGRAAGRNDLGARRARASGAGRGRGGRRPAPAADGRPGAPAPAPAQPSGRGGGVHPRGARGLGGVRRL
ncbi:MAG: Protoporphyrin IX Mg-chelatase subunit I, partial [uncultured Acetobacteraceae bacterium]